MKPSKSLLIVIMLLGLTNSYGIEECDLDLKQLALKTEEVDFFTKITDYISDEPEIGDIFTCESKSLVPIRMDTVYVLDVTDDIQKIDQLRPRQISARHAFLPQPQLEDLVIVKDRVNGLYLLVTSKCDSLSLGGGLTNAGSALDGVGRGYPPYDQKYFVKVHNRKTIDQDFSHFPEWDERRKKEEAKKNIIFVKRYTSPVRE